MCRLTGLLDENYDKNIPVSLKQLKIIHINPTKATLKKISLKYRHLSILITGFPQLCLSEIP